MLVRKCDRCGNIYMDGEKTEIEGHEVNGASLNYFDSMGSSIKKRYDLCPDCLRHLAAWLEGEEK